ncbi:hypothetical protein Rctr197k_091 [Virus Rctr197k]|nr:hypothetical protein Rctr197k_091 [Virus Rctr197k]
MANRYNELVRRMPRGSFYDSVGNVIPYRGNNPYELLFSPVTASTVFGVYVSGQFRGEVTSDGAGQAVVRVVLDQGRQDIILVNKTTGAQFPAYVDVRVSATVQAAHADALEGIDTSIDEIQDALSLETVNSRFIEDVYGRPLQQPNDLGGWLTDNYRRLLKRLRQAFRVFGAKLLGLRQVVHGFTSVLPLRVPRAWRPNWTLGYQLMPNGDLQTLARITASELTNLNLVSPGRANAFVHAAFGGAPTIFPGPFTDPPTDQPLQVTFSAAWNGGSVTVTGTDPLGNVVVDTFTPTGGPLPETVVGTLDFQTVTSATKGAGAAGTASIGVSVSRFIVITDIGSFNTLTVPQALDYLTGPDRLRWGGASSTAVAIPTSGTYTLRTPDVAAQWSSLVFEPGGGFVVADEHFLAVEFDDFGVVLVDLSNALFGGGASPRTAAQVVTSINTYLTRDVRYGAVRGTRTMTAASGASITANDPGDAGAVRFTLDDGLNPTVTFEFRLANPVTPGNVLITYLAGDSATTIAGRIVTAIFLTGGALRISAGSSAGSVLLQQDVGGTQGNTAIVYTAAATAAGFAGSPFAGGANSSYSTAVSAIASLNTLGTYLRFLRLSAGPLGPSSTFRVHPTGADGARTVLGEPRYATTLSVGAALRDVVLDVPLGARLPELYEQIILHAAFDDTTAVVSTSFAALTRPSAIEIIFDPAWRGGELQVTGIEHGTGDSVIESFSATPPTVAEGDGVATGAADSVDGINVTAVAGGTFAGAEAGMCFRLTNVTAGPLLNDTVAYVRYVFNDTALQLDVNLGAVFTSGFEIRSAPPVQKGLVLFDSLSQVVDAAVVAAPPLGPAGTATISIIEGQTRGFDVRVGRNMRVSGAGALTISLTVLDATGQTAAFVDSAGVPAFVSEASDFQGWLLIQGAVADGGTNNGLHEIFSLGSPPTPGAPGFFVRHQDAGNGGRFFTEVIPGGATWRIYNKGEVVTVVEKDAATGNLTLYPFGLALPRLAGDLVELEEEMPFTVYGVSGPGTLTVDVDRELLPTAATGDTLVLDGTVVADGWRAYNQAGPALDGPAFFFPRRLQLLGDSVDADGIGAKQALEHALRDVDVAAYRGLVIRAMFWVQQNTSATENLRIDFSFDGSTFTPGAAVAGGPANPQAVVGTGINGLAGGGMLDPVACIAELPVPYDATTCIIRLVHEGVPVVPPPFHVVDVEKCIVLAVPTTSLFMGASTVALTEHQAKFGEVLYVWSPEELGTAEKGALGISETSAAFPDTPGQIDRITNAHGYWERFDITEYTGTPATAVNLRGSYDELAWAAAALTNMEVVVGTPPRTSIVRPSAVSLVEGEVLSVTAPSNAALVEISAHEGPFPEESFDEERLFEDGLPVPATPAITGGVLPWRFIAPAPSQTVQIASVAAGDPAAEAVYNAAAVYTIDYRRLIRVEPEAFDLGASFADYLWLVDAAIYRRGEPSSLSFSRTAQLTFLANYRATLVVQSDKEVTTSTLVKDTGISQSVVPVAQWRYVDSSTVEIDADAFDPNAIFSLTYTALEANYPRPAIPVIETRSSAVSLPDVLLQTWRSAVVDEVVDQTHRYHQLRVTISGVVDVRDIEIMGLGLRGIHLFGASPYAPGIIV